jgi:hypothetical protein
MITIEVSIPLPPLEQQAGLVAELDPLVAFFGATHKRTYVYEHRTYTGTRSVL